jgi:PAS domain S-box-containing protein
MQTAPPPEPRELLRRSAAEVLRLAASVCNVRHGVTQLRGEPAIASGPAVPLDAAAQCASVAGRTQNPLTILTKAQLPAVSPAIGFYASVRLVDSLGAFRGTFAVLDERPRRLTGAQEHLLAELAAQWTRVLEIADSAQQSSAELRALQFLSDGTPVAVFHYGIASGRFSYVNATFAQTLGYSVEEILALDSVTDIIVDDQRDVVREMIARRQAGEDGNVRYVTKVQCRDGRYLDAEVHASVAGDGGARIVIGAAVDITSQVAATQHLRDREEYFRALTDQVSDVIAIISGQGVLTYVSPSVARVLGHHPEELIGGVGWPPVHPDDRERLRAAVDAAVSGRACIPTELRVQHKNGNWRTLELACANLLDHSHIRGLVFNFHDITDRKRMEYELRQLDRLTSLGRLATQVAHEFNNVLMGIEPIADVIRRRATADPVTLRLTEIISASVRRGKRITTDILRYARPAQVTLQPVDVHQLVKEAADEIRPLLGARIELHLALDVALMQIQGDPAQLVQVLVNLALNARDAMEPAGGVLTVEAWREDGDRGGSAAFIHIRIRDTGSGIDAGDLPYVFEPLFTTKQRGTGLGLSVVFQVVTAHKGRISVESERGEGTTFHISIPAALPEDVREEMAGQEKSRVRRRSLRVLVVEDEEAVAQALRWSLEAAEVEVHLVTRGADVLPAIAAFQPDALVLDLSLPDEDGREVYRRVAAVSSIPVVFSSGHASEADVAELAGSSRTAFLMKPYGTDELLDAIHALVPQKAAGPK